MPLRLSAGGGTQLTRTVVEPVLTHVTFWGGADGAGEDKWEESRQMEGGESQAQRPSHKGLETHPAILRPSRHNAAEMA